MNKEEGFVHYTDEFTYILDNKDIDQAKTIWRISKMKHHVLVKQE